MGGYTVGSSLLTDSCYLVATWFCCSSCGWSREKSRMGGSTVGSSLLVDSSYLVLLLLLWLVQGKV
jgi:hypothetical protein